MSDDVMVIKDSGSDLRFNGMLFAGASLVWFVFKMMLPGLLFLVIGLGVAIFATDVIVTADRGMRTMKMEQRGWLFRRAKLISFDDIARVDCELSSANSSANNGYRLSIVLKDGGTLPFRKSYVSSASYMEKQARELTTYITGREATVPAPAASDTNVLGKNY